MLIARRLRPSFWKRWSLQKFNQGETQHVWEDAWLDRCRERAQEPYLRMVESKGQISGGRFSSIDPSQFQSIDASGNLYQELSPMERLEAALAQGADCNKPFALPLEGLTKAGRRRYELVLNAEFEDVSETIQARLNDAKAHREKTTEAASSRTPDPLYPPLPRHWKEARTALDWCLLLGDDEAIERLGLIHATFSEQDSKLPSPSQRISIEQTSVLPPLLTTLEPLSRAHERRWHRTARRLETLDRALIATDLGRHDDPGVPAVSRGGDFRAIIDSAELDTLDEDGRHVYQALLEGIDGPRRQHAQGTFWRNRYAIGGRSLPETFVVASDLTIPMRDRG